MGGGRKVPYPKHVWSPSGGWYAQPANWRQNTAIATLCIIGISAVIWNISSKLETRYQMPEEGRFFPSRYYNKQIIEYERAKKEQAEKEQASKVVPSLDKPQ